MKLYYAPGACSLSPHIVLREAERRFDLERVDLRTRRTARGVDYRSINPKGYIPALEIGTQVLTEGPAIVQYIGDLVPERKLVPPAGTFARYHLQEWLNFVATEIHKQFSWLFRDDVPETLAAKIRGTIGERFGYVNGLLADRAYLMGETFGAADAYLMTMLQWCDRFGIDLHLWPNLDDYELRISKRPAVQAAFAAEGLQGRHHWKRTA